MDLNEVFKIKDSVDVYLVDDKYLVIYFMNTRIRKKFLANKSTINLFEQIDGEKTLQQIYDSIPKEEGIAVADFMDFITKMIDAGIIIQKLQTHILKPEDMKRYSRQLNYFAEFLGSEMEAEQAQKKLVDTRIGIIGCGSVGGDIALQLAMAGIEHFVLMDYNTVEESDCSRHMYYDSSDIGRKKVEVLSDKLKQINKNITTYISYAAFTPASNMDEFISKVDFVIDAADEPYLGYTANLVSQLCVPLKMAHYIAGGFDAHLASTGELVIPYVTPCAACYSTYFAEKLKDWKPKKHPVAVRANEIGGLSSMSLFSASYACIEIVKYIAGLLDMNSHYHKRAEFFFEGMNLVYLNPQKDPHCKVCGDGNV